MKRALIRALTRLAERDDRVVVLTADLGFGIFDDFAARFGPRFVNVGVAEAQMLCMAAGLALEGLRPVTYSIAAFHLGRAYEQIRLSVAYHGLPVTMVGVGGGYGYAESGVTHHAVDDLALMSGLPGMTVVAAGDPNETAALAGQILDVAGPVYLRIGRGGEACYDAGDPPVIGRARRLRDGEGIAILTTGDVALVALEAADALGQEGIRPAVWQMHTVKPLDTTALDRLARSCDRFLVVEEHAPVGGLMSAVAAWRLARDVGPALTRLGPPDALALGNPLQAEIRRRFGYDAGAVVAACRATWPRRALRAAGGGR